MKARPLLLLFPLFVVTCYAGMDPDLKLVRLHNGINSIDLTGDGKADSVVVAERDNFNAHSYEVSTVYVWTAPSKWDPNQLHVVPIERTADELKKDEPERLSVISGGGADCMLHDFRLFRNDKNKSVILITADRDFGDSLTDSQHVTFKYYKLMKNLEGIPGWPAFYFKQCNEYVPKAKYCDVDVAFQKELGVPSDGRPLREAGEETHEPN